MESVARLAVDELVSEAVFVSSTDPISKIVGVLRNSNSYEVMIREGNKIGMITLRDMLNVSNVVTKASSLLKFVPKLSMSATVQEAAQIMTDYRIRALPVVDNDKVLGRVTALSIINAFANRLSMKVKMKDIMTPSPITINADDVASKAKNLMIRRKIDHLPVINDGKLAGVVSSAHIVNAMIPSEGVERGYRGLDTTRRLEVPIKDLMTALFITSKAEEEITSVLSKMTKQNATCTVVALWDEIQGIATHRDYVKLVASPKEKPQVPAYIIGLPDDPFEAEAAKDKFIRTVNALSGSFPYILEARANIKVSEVVKGKERRRYEVSVRIKTAKETYSYAEVGWELPAIFDVLSDRIKRLLTQKQTRRKDVVRAEYPE